MKRKLLLLSSIVAMAIPCFAGNYLHFKTSDGWQVLDIDEVERLAFEGGQMIATDANGSTVAAIDRQALERMYVDETSGVETITTAGNAAFRYIHATKSAEMLTDGLFELYSTDGQKLVGIQAKAGEKIDLSNINPGTVVMKSGKTTIKAILR